MSSIAVSGRGRSRGTTSCSAHMHARRPAALQRTMRTSVLSRVLYTSKSIVQRGWSSASSSTTVSVTSRARAWTQPGTQTSPNRLSQIRSPSCRLLASAAGVTAAQQPVTEQVVYDGMPKLLVFGGNGFVGTRVCEEALSTGLQIVSINRSGRPKRSAAWMDQVDWVKADVFDVPTWRSQLEGAVGVVSCIGAFGSNDFMFKICGESNATVFREAAAAGIERASFISVADYKLPDWVLSGYFRGKRYAEQVLQERFPETGVALRPGFMHGTRMVGQIGVPLSAIGWPLEKVLSYMPTQELAKYPGLALGFVPPVAVGAVAKAAVAAATDSVIPPGPMDVWKLQQFETS